MADLVKLADDPESFCRLVDPTSGPVHVPINEMNSQGALLDSRIAFQPNDYIDITLHLRGVSPRPLFAHVVTADGKGVRVRWLHFEPADEAKLKSLLTAFAQGEIPAGDRKQANPDPSGGNPVLGQKDGTRRVVRPSTVFTPFSDAAPAEAPRGESARTGTRRIVRPTAPSLEPLMLNDETGAQDALVDLGRKLKEVVPKPAARAPAAPAAPFEEASGAQVVISPTAKFNKLPSAPDDDHQTESGTGKVGIVGQDGKLDIGASIRSKAKTVRASELAARHDRVRVLNMNTIKGLIQEAVAEAMQHIGASIGETERKRLLEEAEANFQEKLKAFQAEKSGSEEKAKRLQDQLRMAQDLLEQERKRTVSKDQFTVSAAGMGEIEERLRRVLDHAIATGNVSPELEAKLREMIAHILDTERERIKAQELEAQNAQIDLLQKKIQRLAGSLEETERQRNEAQQLAAALEAQGGGLRGVMVAGINDSDAQKKRKLALMKEILDINRRMREELGVDYVRDDAAVAKIQAEMSKLPDFVRSAEPVAPPPTNSAAELAAAAAERGETGAGAEDDNSPIVNPDDEPWEVQPIQVKSDAERDEAKLGVKRINVGAKAPPPLEKKQAAASTKSAGDTAVTDSSAAVDPDDQAWEVQPMQTQAPGAVKKINVTAKEPPPLERTSKPGT